MKFINFKALENVFVTMLSRRWHFRKVFQAEIDQYIARSMDLMSSFIKDMLISGTVDVRIFSVADMQRVRICRFSGWLTAI